jgi:hypothetical protein
LVEGGNNPSKYVKYTPEGLEAKIGEFFEKKSKTDSN